MRKCLFAFGVLLSLTSAATPAHAQVASFCLRPLAIQDKWVENQTPPWDPTDTFDPSGPNPDAYATGFNPADDHGTPLALTEVDGPVVTGHSTIAVQTGFPDAAGFFDSLVQCSQFLHPVGGSLALVTGSLDSQRSEGIDQILTMDPDASWDATANAGRGAVVNSAFPFSPRVLALPVIAPGAFGPGSPVQIVKIVGFFVSHRNGGTIHGYLTGFSRLHVPDVTARAGDYALLSATFTGPGSPIVGLPIEFLVNDTLVATVDTDGTGTANPPTLTFNTGSMSPGTHASALKVRLGSNAGFFFAEENTADVTILNREPTVTWNAPESLVYGTSLDSAQLNATADVPGTFVYSPQAGAVLPVGEHQALNVTFIPDDSEQYEPVTSTVFLDVGRAPLTVAVASASKLYLDPLPAFSVTASGFVNGDTPAVLLGAPVFQTTATSTSAVGTYPVTATGLSSANYVLTYQAGVLTIASRPSSTALGAASPNRAVYGQAVTIAVAVNSAVGTPTGSVTLFDGGTPIGSAALVDGAATFAIALNAGTHALSAAFNGGNGFLASSSPSSPLVVSQASTTTQLTSSLDPSRSGQRVDFVAAVHPLSPGGAVSSGSVQFVVNDVPVATVSLTNGVATWSTTTLSTGKHRVSARYLGTANHSASVSPTLQQSVKGGK
jgi:hypothetical protein